jgi:hypothetical protein
LKSSYVLMHIIIDQHFDWSRNFIGNFSDNQSGFHFYPYQHESPGQESLLPPYSFNPPYLRKPRRHQLPCDPKRRSYLPPYVLRIHYETKKSGQAYQMSCLRSHICRPDTQGLINILGRMKLLFLS